jgi:alpha-tubulin suppressor-like RCC1 family protein
LGDKNRRNSPEKLIKSINKETKFKKIACGDYHSLLLNDKNQV